MCGARPKRHMYLRQGEPSCFTSTNLQLRNLTTCLSPPPRQQCAQRYNVRCLGMHTTFYCSESACCLTCYAQVPVVRGPLTSELLAVTNRCDPPVQQPHQPQRNKVFLAQLACTVNFTKKNIQVVQAVRAVRAIRAVRAVGQFGQFEQFEQSGSSSSRTSQGTFNDKVPSDVLVETPLEGPASLRTCTACRLMIDYM
jgi:hypothetical protein